MLFRRHQEAAETATTGMLAGFALALLALVAAVTAGLALLWRIAVPIADGYPALFFQTNTAAAELLYDQVRELAGLTGRERVLDLYCGGGGIALYLADQAAWVTGMEINPAAVAEKPAASAKTPNKAASASER